MRSTTVPVPKYRRRKATNRAFVQIKGKRHYLGKRDSPDSKERYGRFAAEMAVSPAAAEAPPPLTPAAPPLTVVELAAAYLDFAQGYYRKDGRPTDHTNCVRRAPRAVTDLCGHTVAGEFGPLAAETAALRWGSG